MEHRDFAALDQGTLDLKTLRCFDIFEVDTAKSIRDSCNSIDKRLWALSINFDIDRVDVSKAFE
jgi:hypothetical protein